PYATQELFYFLWGQTPARSTADVYRLDQALESALRSENAHFGLLWDGLAASQRLVLLALADEQPGHPLTTDYQRRHSLPAAPPAPRAPEGAECPRAGGALTRKGRRGVPAPGAIPRGVAPPPLAARPTLCTSSDRAGSSGPPLAPTPPTCPLRTRRIRARPSS